MEAMNIYLIGTTVLNVFLGIIWNNKSGMNTLIKWVLLLFGFFGVVMLVKMQVIPIVF